MFFHLLTQNNTFYHTDSKKIIFEFMHMPELAERHAGIVFQKRKTKWM
jgi:hypothetical protein